MRETRNTSNISVGKPERNRVNQIPRRRWEATINIDLRGIA
jgi:hypothetical protein